MFFCSMMRGGLPLSLVFILFCSFSAAEAEDLDSRVERFTGGYTRLVWVQEQTDGNDTFAQKNNMKVMAYDSRDGKGVRVVTDKTDNFYKPIFTPDGKTILVSNRQKHIIYKIDFASGRMKKFASGVAVATWQDPKSRKTWVYAIDGEGAEDHKLTHKQLVRYRLDKPRKRQMVWDKTPLSWSNLDLSADGSMIGGLFPWPHASVLEPKSGKLARIGNGCWTSLSPGNDKILWIFDGAHRNLVFTDTASGETWKTNINGAPGIDGYEVYHPRWSNHFNYFAFTGPYKEGEGGNKIGGGGKEVEIYLGRFDNSLKKIAGWFQVTDNDKADFYPALWIADGPASYLNYNKPEPAAPVAVDPTKGQWPSGLGKAMFLWQASFEANQLEDDSLVGFSQNGVEASGRAIFNRFGEMELNRDGFETTYKDVDALKIIHDAGYLGIELLFTPKSGGAVSGSILTLGEQEGRRVMLGNKDGGLEVSLPAHEPVTVDNLFAEAPEPLHLFLALDHTTLQLFVDGKLAYEESALDDPLSKIDSGRLVFGSTAKSQSGIEGAVSHVVIYGHKILEEQRTANFAAIQQSLADRQAVESIELAAELVEKSSVPAPDSLGAYSRALTVNRYRVLEVLSGSYESEELMVASWAVLDREIVEDAAAEEGSRTRLMVEPFDAHPELEGERLMMDMFEPDLDIYYSVGK